jgi:hypothetical protein
MLAASLAIDWVNMPLGPTTMLALLWLNAGEPEHNGDDDFPPLRMIH